MANNQGEATIRIGDGGTVEIEVNGVSGKGCDAFAFIEEALGTTVEREYKPEAQHRPPPGQANTMSQ